MKPIPNSYNDERHMTRAERWLRLTGRPTMIRGKSKYRGVTYEAARKTKPWKASLTFNGMSYHGGCFDTQEEAALAWNKMALKIVGPVANERLNKIRD